MPFRWQTFAVPKRGNSADEYEDAFAGNPQVGRFAIADGASESSFASNWAKLLVEGFTHPASQPAAAKNWLEPLRQRWSKEVDQLELPWYAEQKRELGASATFLGLILKHSAKTAAGIWLAFGVGDCCFFHLHNEQIVKAFPMTRSQDFGNQPALLNSRLASTSSTRTVQKQDRGKWAAGDRLLLMTDALAQCFLHRYEEGRKPWKSIERLLAHSTPAKAFSSWIDKLREQSGMRNDDVTLTIIDL